MEKQKHKKPSRVGRNIFLFIIIIIILTSTITIVGAGERGVLTTFGKVEDTVFQEGLHFKIPFAQNVAIMDVKTQRFTGESSAASKDLQIVTTEVVLNYRLSSTDVNTIFQTVGGIRTVEDKLIDPAIQESVKASTALFNAEELITQRPLVKEKIKDVLVERLDARSIVVEEISITDFSFSPEFEKAIEAKQVAEQNALKAERDLQRITIEADQVRTASRGKADAMLIEATAEAEAIKIQGQSLKLNQEVLKLRAIEQWNGIMPKILTGDAALPFIVDSEVIE